MFESFLASMNVIDTDFRERYFQDRRVPDVLYQYTNQQGMEGILRNKVFWATHSLHLNDSQEIKYADQMICDFLDGRAVQNSILEKIYYDLLGKKYGKPSIIRAWDDDLYVISFSQNGDHLGQWRAYGDDGKGYAIGIKPYELHHKIQGSIVLAHEEGGLGFIKVSYDVNEQEQIILNIITSAEEIIEQEYQSMKGKERDLFPAFAAKKLSSILWQLTLFYKHPGFKDELEWRVVKKRWGKNVMQGINDDATKDVKYRMRGSVKIPYLELNFTSQHDHRLLPIEEIFLGPKIKEPSASKKLEQFLDSLGYSHNMARILYSSIPYQ